MNQKKSAKNQLGMSHILSHDMCNTFSCFTVFFFVFLLLFIMQFFKIFSFTLVSVVIIFFFPVRFGIPPFLVLCKYILCESFVLILWNVFLIHCHILPWTLWCFFPSDIHVCSYFKFKHVCVYLPVLVDYTFTLFCFSYFLFRKNVKKMFLKN